MTEGSSSDKKRSSELEVDYHNARGRIDKIIKDNSAEISDLLEKIAEIRAEQYFLQMKNWVNQFVIPRNLQVHLKSYRLSYLLGKSQRYYINYAFYYRFGFRLNQNIAFPKILSYELHFMAREGILTASNPNPNLNGYKDDEKIFLISPLASFFHWRIMAEFYIRVHKGLIRIPPDSTHKLFTAVYESTTQNILDFASASFSQGNIPTVDSFREFIEHPKCKTLNSVLDMINLTEFPL